MATEREHDCSLSLTERKPFIVIHTVKKPWKIVIVHEGPQVVHLPPALPLQLNVVPEIIHVLGSLVEDAAEAVVEGEVQHAVHARLK